MVASRNDMAILGGDALFIGRVRSSLVSAAIAIANEAITFATEAYHNKRRALATSVMNAPDNFKNAFTLGVATDANVISDATQAGTVALTAANADAQQALVTDAHIDAAVSGQWDTFIALP